jgi:maltooligosyltrehalose synthase
MDEVSAVLHDPNGEAALTGLWQALRRRTAVLSPPWRMMRGREILGRLFPRQRDRLLVALRAMQLQADDAALPKAVDELLAALRHYRTYGGESGFDPADALELEFASNTARPLLNAEGCHGL